MYQPECLAVYSRVMKAQGGEDYSPLLSQLNHFDTWVQLPVFEPHCLAHLATSTKKSDFIKFAQHKLQTGDTASAIYILEKCKRDNWPDVHR